MLRSTSNIQNWMKIKLNYSSVLFNVSVVKDSILICSSMGFNLYNDFGPQSLLDFSLFVKDQSYQVVEFKCPIWCTLDFNIQKLIARPLSSVVYNSNNRAYLLCTCTVNI